MTMSFGHRELSKNKSSALYCCGRFWPSRLSMLLVVVLQCTANMCCCRFAIVALRHDLS